MSRKYWLMKTEPSTFSISDLQECPKHTTAWEGVRNYQARNLLRDEFQVGDGVLFYHSSCDEPAIMGTANVVRAGYPDPSQFDRKSKYFDDKADLKGPRWFLVDIQLEKIFKNPVALMTLRTIPELKDMMLLKRGSRLSVQPVTGKEWKVIHHMTGLTQRLQ